jgi:hypothetical protein
MLRTEIQFALLAGLLAAGGCISPQFVRLPTVVPRAPAVERRSFEFHDPYADERAGPAVGHRPRGFSEPRTKPRQDLDLRIKHLAPTDANRPASDSTGIGSSYPNAIRP